MSTEDKLKNVSPTFGNTVLPAVVGSQTKYQIIYADPAWDFKGGGIYQDSGRKDRSISSQYKLTKTNDMAKLPIKDITDKDAFFNEQAAKFIKAQELIYEDPKNAKEHFNNGIDACIQCHEVKCGGPIPKIKKLYIK